MKNGRARGFSIRLETTYECTALVGIGLLSPMRMRTLRITIRTRNAIGARASSAATPTSVSTTRSREMAATTRPTARTQPTSATVAAAEKTAMEMKSAWSARSSISFVSGIGPVYGVRWVAYASSAMREEEASPMIDTVSRITADQVDQANASGRTPVVFIHGLWLLPHSWDRWATVFDQAGYAPLTPGWPDDPETVEEANKHPEVFAHKTIGDVADHYADVIGQLKTKPVVIGHSFGGLLTQILAGRGLAAASVAISPAPFRGVLPLPISALRASAGVLRNPANRHRAVPLTYDQFRYAFANAVGEDEAKELY